MSTPYILAKFIPTKRDKYFAAKEWEGKTIAIEPLPVTNAPDFMMFKISIFWLMQLKRHKQDYPAFKYVHGCDIQIKPEFRSK